MVRNDPMSRAQIGAIGRPVAHYGFAGVKST